MMGDLQQASPIPANIPRGIVTEWTVADVQNWLTQSLQIPQYLEQFEKNEIAGDVLVHLDHDALKDLEVMSVGHRLYLLKQIYNLKIAHGIKFEKDDYVPISAPKGDEEDDPPPPNVLKQLRERDSKIIVLESEIKRMTDQMIRLKEDLVPVFKLAREKPLPTPEPPTPAIAPPPTSTGSSLARKFSTKKLFLGGSRRNDETVRPMEISKPLMSPTYLNGVTEEPNRPQSPRSPTKTMIPITPGLVPPTTPYGIGYSAGTDLSSSQTSLTATTGSLASTTNSSYPSVYTPTAPFNSTSPITPRRKEEENELSTASRVRSNSTDKESEKDACANTGSQRNDQRTRPSREARNKDGVTNPMKSFRVNLDDPCYKVLPAAMKKYDVKGREEDYRLYITYGDVERKLSAHEKPLIIFQQLQKEGRNPLFMLRYAGKSRSGDTDRDRDRERNGSLTAQNKDDDPSTPKAPTASGSEVHGRYGS